MGSNLSRVTLWVIVLSLSAWGAVLFLVPDFAWSTLHGAESVSSVYSRYAGAWFLGIAVAAGSALAGRLSARPILVLSLVGAGLSLAALLFDTLTDNLPGPNTWVIWLAILDAALIALLSGMSLASDEAVA